MSNPVRALLSCLAVLLLLVTSMASVCAASCGVWAERGGCHGMAVTMPGMSHAPTRTSMHDAAMLGQPGQQAALHCAGMHCAGRAEATLLQVVWPVAEVPVDAVWMRLPAVERVLPGGLQDGERRQALPPPPLRVPLRV